MENRQPDGRKPESPFDRALTDALEWIIAETAGHGRMTWEKLAPNMVKFGILIEVDEGEGFE